MNVSLANTATFHVFNITPCVRLIFSYSQTSGFCSANLYSTPFYHLLPSCVLVPFFIYVMFLVCQYNHVFPSVLLLLYRLLTNPTALVNLNIACSAHLTVAREKCAGIPNGWFWGCFRAVHYTTPPVLVFLSLDSHFFLPLAFQYLLPPWSPSSPVFSA